MRALHSSLIKPLLHLHLRFPFSTPIFSLSPLRTKYLHSHSFTTPSLPKLTATVANKMAAVDGNSTADHIAGGWYSAPDLRLRDHRFNVPLNYSLDHSSSPKISVFAREVVAVGKEEQPLPYLLYLQGGPGFECPRPTEAGGWISRACEEYRVILMDQRGTGLSTSLTPSSMSQVKSAEDLVNYLRHFRADNIVHDAEFIRKRLVPGAGPWTILGQSFGGFCAVTYLSFAPKGLKHALITGGLPPIGKGCTADAVYKAGFEQLVHQNEKYYKRFPQDIEIVRDVVNYLAESEGGGVPLPSGGILTPRGLQLLGLSGLGSSTGFERLHYLFERAWDPVIVQGAKRRISDYFLNAYERWIAFDANPLYALLHESIYCQGASSMWSAHRIRAENDNKFNAIEAAKNSRPVLFTGEMIFPWLFDEVHALRPFKDAAQLLAEKKDWPSLYDIAALEDNKVPVGAAVYYEDMYVNFKLSMETASQIAGIRLWITNEYMHSGLRDAGSKVLDHLLAMLNGKKPLF
uniref:Proline iminopeptidase n=1 Tax=Nicotiana tabacum TaxID=4097 RepID=A0A1S4DFD9_TOBAC|nr:PREDICTED: proline iminopeptidase-like [Nicotiana tabacum]